MGKKQHHKADEVSEIMFCMRTQLLPILLFILITPSLEPNSFIFANELFGVGNVAEFFRWTTIALNVGLLSYVLLNNKKYYRNYFGVEKGSVETISYAPQAKPKIETAKILRCRDGAMTITDEKGRIVYKKLT